LLKPGPAVSGEFEVLPLQHFDETPFNQDQGYAAGFIKRHTCRAHEGYKRETSPMGVSSKSQENGHCGIVKEIGAQYPVPLLTHDADQVETVI
jgi:hypothetical protein